MIFNRKTLFQYLWKVCAGSLLGLIFPITFVILDLRELEETIGVREILFVVNSQNIYLFSLIMFPSIFGLLTYLFLRIIDSSGKLKEEQKRSAINSKMATIGTLAAGIGHEINNPLTILQMSLEKLEFSLQKEQAISPYEGLINNCFDNVQRIDQIVKGMRLMAHSNQEEMQKTDVHDTIQKTIDTIKNIYQNQEIFLEVDLSANRPFVMGNAGKIQQIILNLLSNSKDAIKEKGPSGTISIRSFNEKKQLKIQVSDNGVGIAQKELNKIFDTFYTTKEVGKGSGLGLNIVFSLVQEMDASISADSEYGEWTTFTLSFKAIQEQERPRSLAEQKEKKVLPRLSAHVLIVEDEPMIQELLQEALSEFGVSSELANNGREALQKLEQTTYDLMITDLKMPKMNGHKLISKVKEDMKLSIPIITISGGVESEEALYKEFEAKGYVMASIKKPFSVESLGVVLEEFLKKAA
jgi:signal transduction histidine kinase/CheY-like chemotaxis protein